MILSYVFEQGDADKNSWVNFQQRVDKAPEQVVRCVSNSRTFFDVFCPMILS